MTDALKTAVAFIQQSKHGVVVKTHGYSPAFLPSNLNWGVDRVLDFLKGEVSVLDKPRAALAAGEAVSVFIIERETFNVLHLQVTGGRSTAWAVVR